MYDAGGAHLLVVGTDEPVYANLLPSFAYDTAKLLRSANGKIGPTGPGDHAVWELETRPLRR